MQVEPAGYFSRELARYAAKVAPENFTLQETSIVQVGNCHLPAGLGRGTIKFATRAAEFESPYWVDRGLPPGKETSPSKSKHLDFSGEISPLERQY